MTSSRDIFTKIQDSRERDQVFFDLAAIKSEVICKTHQPDADTYVLKPLFFIHNELECEIHGPLHRLTKTGEMILQISLGDEKYLCSSPFHLREQKIYIKTNVDLFHLQRRDDFRLRLPASYRAYLIVRSLNSKSEECKFQLIDLSGGGCRIYNNQKTCVLNLDDYIEGELTLPDRPSIAIKAYVRHEKEEDKDGTQTVGLQFVDLTPPMKNRTIALVMDLYRQLFLRGKDH